MIDSFPIGDTGGPVVSLCAIVASPTRHHPATSSTVAKQREGLHELASPPRLPISLDPSSGRSLYFLSPDRRPKFVLPIADELAAPLPSAIFALLSVVSRPGAQLGRPHPLSVAPFHRPPLSLTLTVPSSMKNVEVSRP